MQSTSILKNRNILFAALMSSTALVTSVPVRAQAANLTVEGAPVTINSAQAYDNVLVGDTAPGQLDTVSGGALTISNDLAVGGLSNGADGTVTISGGGTVESNRVFIGYDVTTTASGTMTIIGGGSRLTTSADVYLGENGNGTATLTVSNGASAGIGGTLFIGKAAHATSTVTVSGSGSTLSAAGIVVGDFGPGTLTVANGGLVQANGTITIASNSGYTGTLNIGAAAGDTAGAAGNVVGTDGGAATIAFGSGTGAIVFNHTDAAIDFTANVSGNGNILALAGTTTLSGTVSVGTGQIDVDGGALQIGGSTTANTVFIGNAAGSSGTMTVSGAGATLTAASGIVVGSDGSGVLNVLNGGQATDNGVLLIGDSPSAQGTVTVSGSGSKLTAVGAMSVGEQGAGALTIANGGYVKGNDTLTIGRDAGSQGTVTVLGSDSKLMAGSVINVGVGGTATLTVSNGGTVDGGGQIIVASSADSSGTITVSGSGSRLTSSDIDVGGAGTGTLTISDGGEVSGGVVTIGRYVGGQGKLTVSGTGSKVTSTGDLYVGDTGSGTLTVANGGVVQAAGTIYIAKNPGAADTLNVGAASGATAAAAGSILGANGGAATIAFGAGAGTIVFNHTETDYVFNATVSGSGAIGQEAGYTDLTGDFSGFTGAATVSGGTLAVDTTFGGSVVVQSGGTLTGTGSTGNTTFNAGSIYQVDLTASSSLSSTGTVAIDNGAIVKLYGGNGTPTVGQSVTILSATNITGRFGAVDESYLFLDEMLAYTPTTVDLTLYRNAATFASYAQTPNQIAVANAMESLGGNNKIYQTFEAFTDASRVPGALNQLSGEAHASFQGMLIDNTGTMRDVVGQHFRTSFGDFSEDSGGAIAYADDSRAKRLARSSRNAAAQAFASVDARVAAPKRYEAWIQGYGISGRTNGDFNAADMKRSGGGVYFGVDTGFGTDWRLGAFGGYGYTSARVDDRNSSATADSYTIGAYVGRLLGPVSLQGGTSLTWNDVNSKRDVAFTGFNDHLTADYGATAWQVFGEAAYSYRLQKNMTMQPFAGVAVVHQRTGAFTEQGGVAALSASASSQTVEITSTGLRTAYDLGVLSNSVRASLTGSVAWRHTFGNVTPTETMIFASGSNAFTVSGTPLARDTALLGAGVQFGLTAGTDLMLSYYGAFGSGTQDNSFNARLQAKF